MPPGQLSHQWCDFFVRLIGGVKLPHPEEIGASKSALAGIPARDGGGQFIEHTLASLGIGPCFLVDVSCCHLPFKLLNV